MKEFLYWVVGLIAQAHESILSLNNGYEFHFNDKQLHFLVIGILGVAMYMVLNPIFKLLAKHGLEGIVTWFYTFTVIIVITFAIEIGQKITHTGQMEFADIVFGVVGFFALFAVYFVFMITVKLIVRQFKHTDEEAQEN